MQNLTLVRSLKNDIAVTDRHENHRQFGLTVLNELSRLTKIKVETSDHSKNGAKPKSQMSRK